MQLTGTYLAVCLEEATEIHSRKKSRESRIIVIAAKSKQHHMRGNIVAKPQIDQRRSPSW